MKSAGHKTAADVPMLDLSRQYAGIRNEILAAVARVCDSQHYILGEEVVAFEREFAALCATADCVGCASGTDGLWLALAAAGVGPGDSSSPRLLVFLLLPVRFCAQERSRFLLTSIREH